MHTVPTLLKKNECSTIFKVQTLSPLRLPVKTNVLALQISSIRSDQ